MKTILFFVAALVVAAWWTVERAATAGLRLEIRTHREKLDELELLRRERERLHVRQREIAEEVRRESVTVAQKHPDDVRDASENIPVRSHPEVLTVGEWLPPTAWKNRGSATPMAAVETMLW